MVIRGRVGEACSQQWQRLAKQVVADDFQRGQAELGIEGCQLWFFAIIAGAEPDPLAIVDQAQLKKCSQ
ncbi:hypothetical protein D3C85_1759870 [compost metagenome]